MTDNSSLATALLGLQARRQTPFDYQRDLARSIQKQGTSTAPVLSPLEGIARALQGGVGGLLEGWANNQQEQQGRNNTKVLADALGAPDQQSMTAVLKGYQGDTDVIAPILGQLLSQRMAQQYKDAEGKRAYGAAGGTPNAPPAANPALTAPGAMSTAPLPTTSLPSGALANNSGNIRASGVAWDGKGAPQNGFETFATPQAGANAQFKNFGAYVQANPNITVAQAIAQWSPPNENNTQAVIKRIAEETGINPGMPLAEVLKDPAQAATLLDAQTRLEKGGLPQGFTADTFMQATSGQAASPKVAQADSAPAAPQIGPEAAERFRLAKQAYTSGDYAKAATLQEEGNKAQASYLGKLDEEKRGQVMKQPQENVQNESKLREQFDNLQSVKDYRKAATVFRSAVDAAKANTAAADLNLVYSFATMMDPGSVVREGEMGMVRATQNASDQVKALVAAVSGGQRISPEARRNLVDQMAVRYDAYKGAHDELANAFGGIADRSGMNRQNIAVPLPQVPWERQQGNQTGLQAGTPVYDMNGKRVR